MIKLSLLTLAISAISLSVGATEIDWPKADQPMKYAQEYSKSYAEGDSNDSSGWQGCDEMFTEANEITRIQCVGERDILVLGGHWERMAFACEFTFEPSSDWIGYIVTYELCE